MPAPVPTDTGIAAKKDHLAEVCRKLYREWKPRAAALEVRVEFCRYANANSRIRLADGVLHVKITDLLLEAPGPVLESLAEILMYKLFRRPVPRGSTERYRR